MRTVQPISEPIWPFTGDSTCRDGAASLTHLFSPGEQHDRSFDVVVPAGDLPAAAPERYQPLDVIATGGMGVVYRARDRVLGRVVALKVLREEYAGRPAVAERFFREAQITGQFEHPGVPAVHDAGRLADGRPFIAMQFVRGRPLSQLLAARPSPAHGLPLWLAVLAQLGQALVYAHARGVVHRDVKPANVHHCGLRQMYLLDWGLARLLGEPPDGPAGGRVIAPVGLPDGTDTADGALLGTPAFVSPEQANGRAVDERADVFGLGGVLCVILTNQPPYAGTTWKDVFGQARSGDVSAAYRRLDESGADPRLVGLAKACLTPDPAERPRRVTEVLAALNAARTALARTPA